MKKGKTVKLEDTLGNLTPEQRKEFAAQFNGGLGSGLTPEQYREKYHSGEDGQKQEKQAHGEPSPDDSQRKQRPGIEANVWSRFDDDGYGIYGVQRPTPQEGTDEKEPE
ncbi:MAG: hypothetical protein LUC87_04245 [Clostridiales bacterium]|nr:hypothetical protein [Clostridiales bacterium]